MKENELVLCKVEKVTPTITFVRLPDGKEGTIISSEIAPGRIKYMRQYVVPNKQIVCRILKISGDNIHLSLRRVSSKEKKEILQRYKQEHALKLAFNQILSNNFDEISKKIIKDFGSLTHFINKAKEEKSLLKKYIPNEQQTAFKKITEKKKKQSQLKFNIKIKCLEDTGITQIKSLLNITNKNASIKYVSAGNFKLKLLVDNFKQGKKTASDILDELEKKAKKFKCEFSSSEEK